VATRLGSHAARLRSLRALRSAKGRREQHRFVFEGATLLAEAVSCALDVTELYATQSAYDSTALVRELDAAGTPTFILPESTAATISDLKTASGIFAIAPVQLRDVRELFGLQSSLLILGDLNDPANAGTLLRSAEAFGCAGVVFGRLGVDPYHPKVVRGSMGGIFRIALAVAEPDSVKAAALESGTRILGLTAGGGSLADEAWKRPFALIVGHERGGLARWESLCDRFLAIPMSGRADSLSAAVAGSIALYEANRRSSQALVK
jgi:RNA methyltransferase, TrmH family